jgi:holo-[acyl-carrier protein] synthase
MIYGVGIDLVQVSRVQRMIDKFGRRFIDRMFTDNEIEYSEQRPKSKYQHYSARFAAKEALFKAFKGDWKSGIVWKDIEVINEERGNPVLVLHGTASQVRRKLGITRIEVSLTHTRDSASAIVVAEKGNDS